MRTRSSLRRASSTSVEFAGGLAGGRQFALALYGGGDRAGLIWFRRVLRTRVYAASRPEGTRSKDRGTAPGARTASLRLCLLSARPRPQNHGCDERTTQYQKSDPNANVPAARPSSAVRRPRASSRRWTTRTTTATMLLPLRSDSELLHRAALCSVATGRPAPLCRMGHSLETQQALARYAYNGAWGSSPRWQDDHATPLCTEAALTRSLSACAPQYAAVEYRSALSSCSETSCAPR